MSLGDRDSYYEDFETRQIAQENYNHASHTVFV